jgi:hypothetical protein
MCICIITTTKYESTKNFTTNILSTSQIIQFKTWYLFAINNYIDTQVARRGRQYQRNSKK